MNKHNLPKANVTSRAGVNSDISPKAFQRWNPEVRAAVDDDTEATISILDPIGADFWSEGVTNKRIAAALRLIGNQPVTVNVNSPGGDYWEGLGIYNTLREHKAHVTVNVLGIAASAASVIAMAGDTVRIARAGFLMIHNTWIGAIGDRHAMREVADWLEPFDAAAVDIYAARTGLDRAVLAAMCDRETWMGGSIAVDQGFADELLASDEIDTVDDSPSAALRAEKKFDLLARRAGLTNSASRELLRELKSGMPGAAQPGKPGAADIVQDLNNVLDTLKSI